MRGQLQHTLGLNVRSWRLEHGLSQEDLGERWGWSRGYISKLERGGCNVSLQTLEYIAGLMEIEPLILLSQPRRQVLAVNP